MAARIERRHFLLGSAAVGAVALRPDRAVGAAFATSDEDALDAALGLIQKAEPECRQGLSTHAPMVSEALTALGQGGRAVEWVERYRAPLLRLPGPSRKIDSSRWRAALGPDRKASSWETANARWGDWKEFFTAALGDAEWREVLDTWVRRLAPGISGAATHGVIRTSHAVRALSRRNTAVRRGELARGLAYWASAYEELPSGARPASLAASIADALAEVPLYWSAFGRQPRGRNIVEQLRQVAELSRFGETRWLIAEPEDVGAALSALTATFARVYLRHGSKHNTIAFVHAITGPSALRRIVPHIKATTARAAFPHAWQAAAAIYAAYARPEDRSAAQEPALSTAELVASAIRNGDEHAIKFTEVLVGEHSIIKDPAYLLAAEDAIQRL